jgi:hypothetical protein
MNTFLNAWKTRLTTVLSMALLLSACLPVRQEAQPTPDIQAAYTAAAQTVIARLTQEVGGTAVAELTQIAAQPGRITPPVKQQAVPSATQPPPPTATSTSPPPPPTDTPLPTPTLPSPTPPPPTPVCDLAEMVGDITIPPDSLVLAGSVFSKVWRVRNVGACTWDNNYTLNYTGGDLVGSVTTIFLPRAVPPGSVVDLSVPIVAPAYEGVFQSTWALRNGQGQYFGVGTNASIPLLVRARTTPPALPTGAVFDLAAYACIAEWRSSTGRLSCPGQPNSADGGIMIVQRPLLESRQATTYGLWTHPDINRNGWIQGIMPLYTIHPGDRFVSEIGCMGNSPGCDVFFEFGYRSANGTSGVLGRWREVYDGQTTPVDLDLSSLTGQAVQLMLSVTNNGIPQNANAIWLQPRVEKQGVPSGFALTWTREGAGGTGSCEELRVTLNSFVSGLAQAYDCSTGSRRLAERRLSENELTQLLNWVGRLETFSGEIYTTDQGQAILSWVYVQGTGSGVASDADIQALNNFAAQIFRDLSR